MIPTLLRCNRVGKFAKRAQTWQSSLSSEKCCDIRLSLLACKNPVNYHINDVVLNTVDIVRDLGISVDNKLTFVEHINLIVRPLSRIFWLQNSGQLIFPADVRPPEFFTADIRLEAFSADFRLRICGQNLYRANKTYKLTHGISVAFCFVMLI